MISEVKVFYDIDDSFPDVKGGLGVLSPLNLKLTQYVPKHSNKNIFNLLIIGEHPFAILEGSPIVVFDLMVIFDILEEKSH